MDPSAGPSTSRRTRLPPRLHVRPNGTDHPIPRGTEYTSLRDVFSAATPAGDVAIRNPLVQYAAYAYLQPKESPRSPQPGWPLLSRSNHENDREDGRVGLCSGLAASLRSLLRGLAAALRGRRLVPVNFYTRLPRGMVVDRDPKD